MIEVTSKNRSPAKRLLNNWHDSREVRTWTLGQLSTRLTAAINEGLITLDGVRRVLDADYSSKPENKAGQSGAQKQDTSMLDEEEKIDGDESGADGEEQSKSEEQDAQSEQDGDGENEEQNQSDKQGEQSDGEESDAEQDGEEGSEEQQQSNGVDRETVEKMIREAIDGHRKDDGHAVRSIIIKDGAKETKIDGAHHMLPTVMKYIKAGQNVALVGPAGTGKSTMVHMIAKALGKEFRGCGALLNKYELIGFIDANGNYQETPLHDAFVNGHLFCFDEFDGSSPDATVAFNAITDNQNIYAFPNGMQEKHADFVAVACMNTYGNGADADYVGRFKQDAASMSRFVRVFVDYDRNIEWQLGDEDIVKRVWSLRAAVTRLGIRHIVSTRMIVQAQAARAVGVDNKEIDRDILFSGLNEATIKQVAAQMKAGG